MKLASSVTLSGSMPRCSTMTFLTRSLILLIVFQRPFLKVEAEVLILGASRSRSSLQRAPRCNAKSHLLGASRADKRRAWAVFSWLGLLRL